MANSTSKARRKSIQETYEDTTLNYYNDMAATKTAKDAEAVERNYHEAELMWLRTMNEELSKNGAQIETAYKDLNAANKAVAKARATLETMATLTKKVATAIEAGNGLAAVAKA